MTTILNVLIGYELRLEQFKETEHQVCLSHVWAKYVNASDQGSDKKALVFTDSLDFFFKKERDYNKENFTPE